MDRLGDRYVDVEPSPSKQDEFSIEEAQDERAMDSGAREAKGRPDSRMLFTILTLALLFVGPRFLEGTAVVVLIVVIFIARWLYGRWQVGSSTS